MRFILTLLVLTMSVVANEKVALVIGNKNYINQTGLKNPISDAKYIRDILKEMNFEVVEVYDADLDALDSKLHYFNQQAARAKIAVVYYAGHGIGVDGKNYLVPLGAKGLSVRNLSRKLLSVDELKEAVAQANSFGLILFDACRNSLFNGYIQGLANRSNRALTQPKVSQKNVLVSFSTQPNTIAKDDVNGGNHSPYVLALGQYLKENRDIRQVMGSVRDKVWTLTSHQQYPIEENMLGGEEYCLSGKCQQRVVRVINDEENRKLRERIAFLERQQREQEVEKVELAEPEIIAPKSKPQLITSSSNVKWLTPTDSTCTNNGGVIGLAGECIVNWQEANNICFASGGKLPSEAQFNKVITDCGGEINKHKADEYQRNRKNSSYQACYKHKGFISDYWSSTIPTNRDNYAWVIYFYGGDQYSKRKNDISHVRCVRVRK